MSWLLIVIIAHGLNAIVFVIDKILLGKYLSPRVYTLLVGILGLATFALAPFGMTRMSWTAMGWDILTGMVLMGALFMFNAVMSKYEASRVVPIVGGAVPIFTALLAYLFLAERLTEREWYAFGLLLVGTIVLTVAGKAKERFKVSGLLLALASGFAFAASFVMTKYIFETQSFINGVVWPRVGSALLTGLLLCNGPLRRLLVREVKKLAWKIRVLIVNQLIIGGVAFVLLNYAISLASVSLVNALQGVQYALLMSLVIIGSIFFPKLIKERLGGWILVQKFLAIVSISLGVALIAL